MMNNLVIDAGNTRIKVGIFKEGDLIHDMDLGLQELDELAMLIDQFEIEKVILSDVGGKTQASIGHICLDLPLLLLDQNVKLPFANSYKTKSTLGSDRLALIAGAMHFFPDKNCLAIDAGTCVTYDLLLEGRD